MFLGLLLYCMINHVEEEFISVVSGSIESELDVLIEDLGVEFFPSASEGVIASTVSFELAGRIGESPEGIASRIVEVSDVSGCVYLGELEAVGPYVNGFASSEWYEDVVVESSGSMYGGDRDVGGEISVEHTSVNPTGPLHMGRVRNSILGDSLSNVLEFVGYDVTRQYYVNDAGLQVALLAWAYNNYSESELSDQEWEGDHYDLVRYYQKANEELDLGLVGDIQQGEVSGGGSSEAEVVGILEALEDGVEAVEEDVSEVVGMMLSAQLESLETLGIGFDEFQFESEFMDTEEFDGMLDDLKGLDCAEYSEGAWILDLDSGTFVFERSNGTTLYGTRDIMFQLSKVEEFDWSVVVLGEDQETHISQVKEAMSLLGCEGVDEISPVFHAFVESSAGQMSTRKGEGSFLEGVLSETKEASREEMKDKVTGVDVEEVTGQVAVGTLRYNMLSTSRNQLATFDPETAVSVSEQSGPSIQYAYVRLESILSDAPDVEGSVDGSFLQDGKEKELVELLAEFPRVIDSCIDSNDPHKLAVYAQSLSDCIHSFYVDCPVLSAEDDSVMSNRVKLVESAHNTLGIVLQLLGIPKVKEM